MSSLQDYDLFFTFLKKYSTVGYEGIKKDDQLIVDLEKMMAKNDQYFIIGDLITMNVVFSTKRAKIKLGIEPEQVTPYHFFEATHPEDLQRHSLGRAKVFKIAQDFYISQNGCTILSSNFRMRNPHGDYENTLYQCYLFFNELPAKTVFLFQLLTNIDQYNLKKGFHYYLGNDLSYFRFPDEELLDTGLPFSAREFEIIQLAGESLSSEQIAEKLFLSTHTVNTHRRNILKKSGQSNISDLILSLKEQGLL